MRAQGWPVEQTTLTSCKPCRMTLNGLGDGISIDCDHDGRVSRRIFQSMLPGQVIAFVHGAAQRDAGLLQCADIARDAHQNQSLCRQVT